MRSHLRYHPSAIALMVLLIVTAAAAPGRPPAAGAGPGIVKAQAVPGRIRKQVTERANFVLYLPEGWTCAEQAEEGRLSLAVEDPEGRYGAEIEYGPGVPSGVDQARFITDRLARQWPDLRLANVMRSADGRQFVFDGSHGSAAKGPREFRCWVSTDGAQSSCSRIEGPAGGLAEKREVLLSVLANVRLTKGAFHAGPPAPASLVVRRLRDGSASFGLPQGWQVQDLGKAQFIALDPLGRFSFMVAKADLVSPQMGINVPGLPVLPFMSPHEALQNLAARLGIAKNMRFLWVERYEELERAAAQGGMAMGIEAFLYTCDGRIGPSKGFTFGMCHYSRVGTWSLSHFTVGAPEAEFDAFAPSFAAMLQSYRIDQAWVSDYIQRGLANLWRLQQQTMQIVSRNAQEIHSMMQAAYEERQTSQDYIDYQRTNYIRGQQDWISAVEGGTVYHSDTWGLTNTATGEFYEGQPFDYVHFRGGHPKYREIMVPVDSRELWERHIRD